MDSDKEFNEEILNLIKQGESGGRIDEILQESCLYNSIDASGKTSLHYSALYNNANLTQNLLNKGCNVDMQDSMGNTPLMIATIHGYDEIMETLIAAGADIFKVNNENKSPLNMVGELHMEHCPTIQVFYKELQKKCSTSEETAKELMDGGCYLYQAAMLTDAKILEDEDLIKWGRPEDVWFHVDKFSLAHVYLRLQYGQTIDDIPTSVLEDAAQLVKANSIEGNKVNDVDVVHTMWSNLKKTQGMDAGQVSFHKEKVVRKIRVAKRLNILLSIV